MSNKFPKKLRIFWKIYIFALIINIFKFMNIKLHTPKSLQSGSGISSAKQFLLSLIATTVSIILTFGTAGLIDHFKKEAEKKEMVMMVISDFDRTIDLVQKADTVLRESRRLQMEIVKNPELYDSLKYSFVPVATLMVEEFSETTEKIFSTSIETFNTIGNVNFVNDVSSFYLARRNYKDILIEGLREDIEKKPIIQSLKALLNIDFPNYVYTNWTFLDELKRYRDKCMHMMNVSEEDLIKFNQKHKGENDNLKSESIREKIVEEFRDYSFQLEQAKNKLKD